MITSSRPKLTALFCLTLTIQGLIPSGSANATFVTRDQIYADLTPTERAVVDAQMSTIRLQSEAIEAQRMTQYPGCQAQMKKLNLKARDMVEMRADLGLIRIQQHKLVSLFQQADMIVWNRANASRARDTALNARNVIIGSSLAAVMLYALPSAAVAAAFVEVGSAALTAEAANEILARNYVTLGVRAENPEDLNANSDPEMNVATAEATKEMQAAALKLNQDMHKAFDGILKVSSEIISKSDWRKSQSDLDKERFNMSVARDNLVRFTQSLRVRSDRLATFIDNCEHGSPDTAE